MLIFKNVARYSSKFLGSNVFPQRTIKLPTKEC